jgi:AcrR family transcriptional regulator
VSQIESVRPSIWVAPSIWNEAVAAPHENPTGNVSVEGEAVVLGAVTVLSMGQGVATQQIDARTISPEMGVTGNTRIRVVDAALDLFGTRGVDAVSLDEIAREVGVRKQTVLYWFPSKDDLVDAVLETAAAELVVVIDAAVRSAPDDPLDRIDAVVRAVFRPAVRRPALLGLVREVGRLPAPQAARLREHVAPLVERAIAYLDAEMGRGRLRRADPGLVAALAYATVTGIATEPEALRAVGWRVDAAGLRRLRAELLAFLRAALEP